MLVRDIDLSLIGLRSLSTEHGAWLGLLRAFKCT